MIWQMLDYRAGSICNGAPTHEPSEVEKHVLDEEEKEFLQAEEEQDHHSEFFSSG